MTQKEIDATQKLIMGMEIDELMVVIKCLPDNLLMSEIIDRFYKNANIVANIKDYAKSLDI